mmetsp:Transcript_28965/g.51585  ORF Transcript_28965/g.51585 Transcript_28965/m.51585 type:complete len:82 (+) Transcript_28965:39-284(+)
MSPSLGHIWETSSNGILPTLYNDAWAIVVAMSLHMTLTKQICAGEVNPITESIANEHAQIHSMTDNRDISGKTTSQNLGLA